MARRVINGAVGGGGENPHGKVLQELRGQLPPPRREGQHGCDGDI
nr:MAG TPA: serine/threonine-protein kinase [Caudoviricetes sp.]